MPITLNPSDLDGLPPEEAALLQSADAEALLAQTGTSEPGAVDTASTTVNVDSGNASGTEANPAEGADDADEGEGDTADAALSPEQIAAALEETTPAPTAAPAPKPYTVPETDFDAQRKALRAEIRAVEEKWNDGQLTDAERIEQLDALETRRDELLIQATRAQTLREANEQTARQQAEAAAQAEVNACAALMKQQAKAIANKQPGIDYSKPDAQAEFDDLFTAINRRPENANLSAEQRVAKAHNAMLALRGISAAPAAAAAPAATPAAQARRNVPTTLSGIPDAGVSGVKDDALETAGRLQGEDLERWLAGQPAGVVDRLMRIADNSGVPA